LWQENKRLGKPWTASRYTRSRRAAWRSGTEYSIWMPKEVRKPRPKPPGNYWFVYILRCADGSLYTGIAKDVSCRCQQHNAGIASRYTRSRLPVVVIYQETHPSRTLALRREAAIKVLSRRQKMAMFRLAG
jgi:putative endonuclease